MNVSFVSSTDFLTSFAQLFSAGFLNDTLQYIIYLIIGLIVLSYVLGVFRHNHA